MTVLKTKDDALIAITFRGIRHGPPDVVARNQKEKWSIRQASSGSIRCSRPRPHSSARRDVREVMKSARCSSHHAPRVSSSGAGCAAADGRREYRSRLYLAVFAVCSWVVSQAFSSPIVTGSVEAFAVADLVSLSCQTDCAATAARCVFDSLPVCRLTPRSRSQTRASWVAR